MVQFIADVSDHCMVECWPSIVNICCFCYLDWLRLLLKEWIVAPLSIANDVCGIFALVNPLPHINPISGILPSSPNELVSLSLDHECYLALCCRSGMEPFLLDVDSFSIPSCRFVMIPPMALLFTSCSCSLLLWKYSWSYSNLPFVYIDVHLK